MLRKLWLPGLIVVLTTVIVIQSQRMQDEALIPAIILTPVASPATFNMSAVVVSPTPDLIFTQAPLPVISTAAPIVPTPIAIAASTTTPVIPTAAIEPMLMPSATVVVPATTAFFEAETASPIIILPTETPDATATTAFSQPPSVIMHTVQRGDTLYQIALAYGVTVETLVAANNIADASQIFVGQQLVISDSGQPIATSTLIPALASGRDVTVAFAANDEPPPLPASIPPDISVNNLTLADFLIMPPKVVENIRAVYDYGKILNRNPRAFSKLGDSTIENPHFLTRFDESGYNLGVYAYLQPVIDYYHGSFSRQSRAVIRGLHTWSVLDPMWAAGCLPGENMLACEFRIHNPAIIFVRLGSNDKGVPASTEKHLREVINYCLGNGVIPIMGTKADRFDGAENINNQIIRQLAAELKVPLWDFDLLAGTIPGRGLGPDHVHMTTFFAHDWTQPEAYTTGNGVHSITALMVLDAVWRTLSND